MPSQFRVILCGLLLASSAARAEDGRYASPNGVGGKVSPAPADDVFDMTLPPETPAPAPPQVIQAPRPTPTFTAAPPPSLPSVTARPTATGDHVWAVPTEADRRAPWNRQDPWNSWGTSNRVSFYLGFQPFVIGGPKANTADGSQTATEVGVAYSFGGGFGIRATAIEPVGMLGVSFTFMRNRGVRFYDWGDPDVAIGYAMIAPEVGFATDFTGSHSFVTAGLSLGGIRTVVGDLLSVDLRLTPTVWLEPVSSVLHTDTPLVSFSLGFTIDLGLVH